jgi:hypothetical protein
LFVGASRRDHEQDAIKAQFPQLSNPSLDPAWSHFLGRQYAEIELSSGFPAPQGFRADCFDPAR